MDGAGMSRDDSVVNLDDMAQTTTSRGSKGGHSPFDRRTTAWIPSSRAAQVFAQPLPAADKRLSYTMPGIMQEAPLGDPVGDLAKKHLGDVHAAVVRPSVERSTDGLRRLIASGNLRSAVDLTGVLLAAYNQGFGKAHSPSKHTVESLELWCVRFQLLMALKMNTLLHSELETFGDLEAPDMFFQYYPEIYPMKRGSMVPFSMRVIHAEAAKFTPNPSDALTRLNKLIANINAIMSNLSHGRWEDGSVGELSDDDRLESEALWKSRLNAVRQSMARTFFTIKEYHLASASLAQVCHSENCSLEEKSRIYSSLGRINLELGDQQQAAEWFQKCSEFVDPTNPAAKGIVIGHKAYQKMFYGNYAEAYELMLEAAAANDANVDVSHLS
uniref:Trafficking protein particle complex subunit 12 n=1 Tax=Plectus sambesii TaxID=2011161 RepID=A0A914XBR1_9BILA